MNNTTYQKAREFIKQRPGFDTCNYSTKAQYDSDARPVIKQRKQALALLDYCQNMGINIEGNTGRITVKADSVEYITGQYFATEYRKAIIYHLERCLMNWGATDSAIKRIKNS